MSKQDSTAQQNAAATAQDDDEPDEWYVSSLASLLRFSQNPQRKKNKREKTRLTRTTLADRRILLGTNGSSAQDAQVYYCSSLNCRYSLFYFLQLGADEQGFTKDENSKLTDCYFEKKDWRQCKKEVSCVGRPGGTCGSNVMNSIRQSIADADDL